MVVLRIGIVLAPEGGALAKMLPVFNIFAGGPLGEPLTVAEYVHIILYYMYIFS